MDCRTFRASHVAFVDDTLPGVDQQAMWEHLRACPACTAHDTRVRRSLMAARSLEPIHPSVEFSSRLRSRLAAERLRIPSAPLARGPSLALFAATAAAVICVGVLAVEFQVEGDDQRLAMPRLPAVVASVPAVPETLFASSSAFAAAVSTSAPVWSLAYVADQVPIRFATAQLADDLRER